MRRLTKGPSFDTHPTWSGDGKTVAYVAGVSGPVRLIDAWTGTVSAVASQATFSGPLAFHANGQRLLGATVHQDGWAVVWLDLATGEIRPLLEPTRHPPVFALSRDGRHVAYGTYLDVTGTQWGQAGPQTDIWVVPSAGGAARKVTRTRSRVYQLTWQGFNLIYATDLGGAHNNLWATSLSASGEAGHTRKLTNGLADQQSPSLSRDGRWLTYIDNTQGVTTIVVRDRMSGREHPVVLTAMDFGVPTGILDISVFDKATGEPTVGRISITGPSGSFYAPPGVIYRVNSDMLHVHRQVARLTVPAGQYVIRGARGLEYREVLDEVGVSAGSTVTVRLDLERWIDPAADDWYSGESHIHANYSYSDWYSTPESLRWPIQGENLNVANLLDSPAPLVRYYILDSA